MKFGEKLFQTKLLSRLSLMACRLLYSPVLLLKFTSYDWSTVYKGSKQLPIFDYFVYPNNPRMFSGQTKSFSLHLSRKEWVTVRIRLSFASLPLPLPPSPQKNVGSSEQVIIGKGTLSFPLGRLLMTKATRVMSASLI